MTNSLEKYIYYKTDLGVLYKGDCMKILPLLDDKSIDLILTDPPYGLRWKEEIKFKDKKNVYHKLEEVKSWDKDKDIKDLYVDIMPLLDKKVKESGSVLMFTRIEYITWLVDEARKNDFEVKNTIIWHKTNPVLQIRKKTYLSSIESIVWLARERDKIVYKFNFLGQNEMHNFYEGPICMGKERVGHPTQKPIKLINKLLTVHSDEGDLIVDPFLGSGTTAVACEQMNRKWVGIELNEDYCKLAKERLEAIKDLSTKFILGG